VYINKNTPDVSEVLHLTKFAVNLPDNQAEYKAQIHGGFGFYDV